MMPRLCVSCLAFVVLVVWPVGISSRSYSNGLIFYELSSHTPYLPPTVSVSRGRNLASVKYSEKGSIWSTFGQPCECSGPMCSCCAGLKVDQYNFDQKVCANVSFVPQLEEARLEVFLNGRPSSKYGISVRNPSPFCIPVMMGVPMAMCVQMTDVAVVGNNLNMCMDFVVRMATTDLFEMHFQCMRMGAGGLQYVDKNGKPVLPQAGQQDSDDPEEYEYAELEDQPEYGAASQEKEDYQPQPEEKPAIIEELVPEEPVGPAQIIDQLKENVLSLDKQPLQNQEDQQNATNQSGELSDDQPIGYQPLVIEPPKDTVAEEQPAADHRPQEEEDPEPLPIESEMLMAGDQSEDPATEYDEATEEATEEGKETELQTETPAEKEVETGTEAEAAAESEAEAEAPDNDHDNDNDNDNGYGYGNGSESGPRPQVIETITNSMKATEAPATTTTTTTKAPAPAITTTTTTQTITIPTTTTKIPIANIAGIDYTNNGEKTATEEEEEEEEEEDKVKKSSEAEEKEKEEEADEGDEGEEPEQEAEDGEATTLAVEMENDSDNEINVDDDNDDYDGQHQVKEPPNQMQQDDNEEEEEEEGEQEDEEEEEVTAYGGEEAAEETEAEAEAEAATAAAKSSQRRRRRRNRGALARRLGKLH